MSCDAVTITAGQGVAVVQMNRPEDGNRLSTELVAALERALIFLDADSAIKVVVLTGTGRHFSSGADIDEILALSAQDALERDFSGCCRSIGEIRKPVIAAVNGHAFGGGCELVEMCDIVVAADTARFGHPEAMLATMPGGGATQRLPRLVGRHMAMDMLLSGRLLTAEEALRCGLVSRVVTAGNVLAEARSIAEQVADLSAPVVRLIKEAVNQAEHSSLAAGLSLERRLFALSCTLADRREAINAFLEKRGRRFSDG